MLTDLHLRKYLEGRLSAHEETELEKMLESHPDLRLRLEHLRERPRERDNPAWRRLFLDRKDKSQSRVRFQSVMPVLFFLALVIGLGSHWLSRPGTTSTFTLARGNAGSLELLYDSPSGWKYLDRSWKPQDSLSFALRDTGHFHIAISALDTSMGKTRMRLLFNSGDSLISKESRKPVFALPPPSPSHAGPVFNVHGFLAWYSPEPLPAFTAQNMKELLALDSSEANALDFHYQLFLIDD